MRLMVIALLTLAAGAGAEETKTLTSEVLESDYFDDVFGRLETQYPDYPWFPSHKLRTTDILTLVEYQDRTVFVIFSETLWTERDTHAAPTSIRIPGPAVIFSVIAGDHESKFGDARLVSPTGGERPDLSKHVRHIIDPGAEILFTDGTGKHGTIVAAQVFRIPSDDIKKRLARLMGEYMPGR